MGRDHGLFRRPKTSQATRHLLVANCDSPGDRLEAITALFAAWDRVAIITLPPGPATSHCFVSLADAGAAAAARGALNGTTPAALGGAGPLVVSFAEKKDEGRPADAAAGAAAQAEVPPPPLPAVRTAAECGIPEVSLLLEFVSPKEEAALLALMDSQNHWQLLARRRVLHFGFVFDYEVSRSGELASLLAGVCPCWLGWQRQQCIQPLPGSSAVVHCCCRPEGWARRCMPSHQRRCASLSASWSCPGLPPLTS